MGKEEASFIFKFPFFPSNNYREERMGNWNSHPDQTINRAPPMQFQHDAVAEEYYPNEAWLNEYAWMYIVGGVLILFAVLGCCYCLCTMGEKPTPAGSQGYQTINSSPPSAALSPTHQPSMKHAPPKPIYPAFSPSPSVKNYSYGPPVYAQQQSLHGYPGAPPQHHQAGYGPSGVHQISSMGTS